MTLIFWISGRRATRTLKCVNGLEPRGPREIVVAISSRGKCQSGYGCFSYKTRFHGRLAGVAVGVEDPLDGVAVDVDRLEEASAIARHPCSRCCEWHRSITVMVVLHRTNRRRRVCLSVHFLGRNRTQRQRASSSRLSPQSPLIQWWCETFTRSISHCVPTRSARPPCLFWISFKRLSRSDMPKACSETSRSTNPRRSLQRPTLQTFPQMTISPSPLHPNSSRISSGEQHCMTHELAAVPVADF